MAENVGVVSSAPSLWASLKSTAPGTPSYPLSSSSSALANAGAAAASSARSNAVLCVPASQWREMHERLAAMEASQHDIKQYLRVHSRLERGKRERAAVILQSRWRGIIARWRHPIGGMLRRRRVAKVKARSFNASERLHCDPPMPVVATSRTEKRAMRCQAVGRGFLVRRRVTSWRAETAAAVRLQALARGRAGRKRHLIPLQVHRLQTRIAHLECALRSESRKREVSEAFLRRIGEAIKTVHVKATGAEQKADSAAKCAQAAGECAEKTAVRVEAMAACVNQARAVAADAAQKAEEAAAGQASSIAPASALAAASTTGSSAASGVAIPPSIAPVSSLSSSSSSSSPPPTSVSAADKSPVAAALAAPIPCNVSVVDKAAADKARRAAAREAFIAARAAKAAKIGAEARERAARERAAKMANDAKTSDEAKQVAEARERPGLHSPTTRADEDAAVENEAAASLQAAWRAHSPRTAEGRVARRESSAESGSEL